MLRKAGALVALKHVISKGVSLRHLEIRLNIRRVNIRIIAVLRTRWANDRNQIRSVHLTLLRYLIPITHKLKGMVAVVRVERRVESHFLQRNRVSLRVHSTLHNVGALVDQIWVLEKIIGSAVLLEDHYHVLNLSLRRSRGAASATSTSGKNLPAANANIAKTAIRSFVTQ